MLQMQRGIGEMLGAFSLNINRYQTKCKLPNNAALIASNLLSFYSGNRPQASRFDQLSPRGSNGEKVLFPGKASSDSGEFYISGCQ